MITRALPFSARILRPGSNNSMNVCSRIARFGGFENRSKDTNFSYLEYFEEKEKKKQDKNLPPMKFSSAKEHLKDLPSGSNSSSRSR